ncbi:MAG: flavin reductase family protein [Elusimicrobia bacterium]|nr:flavin reductase family protein [Elusimicrobiota bacterium]
MTRKKMAFFERFADLCGTMPQPGAFLTVEGPGGKPNVMTIGWACLGVLWGEPVMEVLVRPSRHTFGLMEKAKHFSVSAPLGKLQKKLAFCGSRSGRDIDKIEACGLRVSPGVTKGVSVVEGCDLYYECELVHKTQVVKENLRKDFIKRYYEGEDFHTIFAGRIVESYSV